MVIPTGGLQVVGTGRYREESRAGFHLQFGRRSILHKESLSPPPGGTVCILLATGDLLVARADSLCLIGSQGKSGGSPSLGSPSPSGTSAVPVRWF